MKRVTTDQFCTSFSADNPPALRVKPGEIFVMETRDRFATFEGPDSPPEVWKILMNLAGPVYVEGAKPGDTLKVEVLDVSFPLDYGWITATPDLGPLGERIPQFRKTKVRITQNGVVFNDKLTMPLRPMICRLGVAPRDGPLASNDKGEFGGGRGATQLAKGSAVYLPVFHEGALFSIADGTATIGDGEAGATSVECASNATLRASIEDRFKVTRLVFATEDEVMTTGEGDTLEAAIKIAINDMADHMVEMLGIDYTDAAMVIASAGDVRTGLAGKPPCTVRVAVPRSLLPL